ncbi:uncharacterized protein PAC_02338 [Phialocephala subalpina]|uniref:Uncharacterized protein n=1 Tax=Phialocephala subalpina TaxID=576137 RepID=A0A1L7WI74_9HELO|nr:uncharacterized protein PAC_02338 [Phialocephala subalpina]
MAESITPSKSDTVNLTAESDSHTKLDTPQENSRSQELDEALERSIEAASRSQLRDAITQFCKQNPKAASKIRPLLPSPNIAPPRRQSYSQECNSSRITWNQGGEWIIMPLNARQGSSSRRAAPRPSNFKTLSHKLRLVYHFTNSHVLQSLHFVQLDCFPKFSSSYPTMAETITSSTSIAIDLTADSESDSEALQETSHDSNEELIKQLINMASQASLREAMIELWNRMPEAAVLIAPMLSPDLPSTSPPLQHIPGHVPAQRPIPPTEEPMSKVARKGAVSGVEIYPCCSSVLESMTVNDLLEEIRSKRIASGLEYTSIIWLEKRMERMEKQEREEREREKRKSKKRKRVCDECGGDPDEGDYCCKWRMMEESRRWEARQVLGDDDDDW